MQRKEQLQAEYTTNVRRSMGKQFNHDRKADKYFKSELKDLKGDQAKKHLNFDKVLAQK